MVPAFLFPKNTPPPEMTERQAILFTKGDVMYKNNHQTSVKKNFNIHAKVNDAISHKR